MLGYRRQRSGCLSLSFVSPPHHGSLHHPSQAGALNVHNGPALPLEGTGSSHEIHAELREVQREIDRCQVVPTTPTATQPTTPNPTPTLSPSSLQAEKAAKHQRIEGIRYNLRASPGPSYPSEGLDRTGGSSALSQQAQQWTVQQQHQQVRPRDQSPAPGEWTVGANTPLTARSQSSLLGGSSPRAPNTARSGRSIIICPEMAPSASPHCPSPSPGRAVEAVRASESAARNAWAGVGENVQPHLHPYTHPEHPMAAAPGSSSCGGGARLRGASGVSRSRSPPARASPGWTSLGEWLSAWGGDSAKGYESRLVEEGFYTLQSVATIQVSKSRKITQNNAI